MKSKIAEKVMWLSLATALISAVVSVWQIDLWLARTQWMLVAVLLGVYGIFLKMKSTD